MKGMNDASKMFNTTEEHLTEELAKEMGEYQAAKAFVGGLDGLDPESDWNNVLTPTGKVSDLSKTYFNSIIMDEMKYNWQDLPGGKIVKKCIIIMDIPEHHMMSRLKCIMQALICFYLLRRMKISSKISNTKPILRRLQREMPYIITVVILT